MADTDYLTQKPAAPTAPKRFLDQRVIPGLIDVAGSVEAALEHWTVRVRRSPGASMGVVLGIGALLSLLLARRRV
jgi:hypothetical protein